MQFASSPADTDKNDGNHQRENKLFRHRIIQLLLLNKHLCDNKNLERYEQDWIL